MTTPMRHRILASSLLAGLGAALAPGVASAMMHMQMQPGQQQTPMQGQMQQMPAQQPPMQGQMPMQGQTQMPMPMQGQMPMQQAPGQAGQAPPSPMQQRMMMMGRMGAMPPQPGVAQPGHAMPGAGHHALLDRIEGRLAFLHAELRITPAQMQAWNEFAGALRAHAQRLTELQANLARATPPGDGSMLLAALEQGESVLAARLEGLRAIRASYGRLHAVLDEAQRRTAEELVWPHLGLS